MGITVESILSKIKAESSITVESTRPYGTYAMTACRENVVRPFIICKSCSSKTENLLSDFGTIRSIFAELCEALSCNNAAYIDAVRTIGIIGFLTNRNDDIL